MNLHRLKTPRLSASRSSDILAAMDKNRSARSTSTQSLRIFKKSPKEADMMAAMGSKSSASFTAPKSKDNMQDQFTLMVPRNRSSPSMQLNPQMKSKPPKPNRNRVNMKKPRCVRNILALCPSFAFASFLHSLTLLLNKQGILFRMRCLATF